MINEIYIDVIKHAATQEIRWTAVSVNVRTTVFADTDASFGTGRSGNKYLRKWS